MGQTESRCTVIERQGRDLPLFAYFESGLPPSARAGATPQAGASAAAMRHSGA
jgi:hypothetical protein